MSTGHPAGAQCVFRSGVNCVTGLMKILALDLNFLCQIPPLPLSSLLADSSPCLGFPMCKMEDKSSTCLLGLLWKSNACNVRCLEQFLAPSLLVLIVIIDTAFLFSFFVSFDSSVRVCPFAGAGRKNQQWGFLHMSGLAFLFLRLVLLSEGLSHSWATSCNPAMLSCPRSLAWLPQPAGHLPSCLSTCLSMLLMRWSISSHSGFYGQWRMKGFFRGQSCRGQCRVPPLEVVRVSSCA
jgi:hypothetical protein